MYCIRKRCLIKGRGINRGTIVNEGQLIKKTVWSGVTNYTYMYHVENKITYIKFIQCNYVHVAEVHWLLKNYNGKSKETNLGHKIMTYMYTVRNVHWDFSLNGMIFIARISHSELVYSWVFLAMWGNRNTCIVHVHVCCQANWIVKEGS